MLAPRHLYPLLRRRCAREAVADRADNAIVAVGNQVTARDDRGPARIAVEQRVVHEHSRGRAACLNPSLTVRGDDTVTYGHHVLPASPAECDQAVIGVVADGAVGNIEPDRAVCRVGTNAAGIFGYGDAIKCGRHAASRGWLNQHAGPGSV